MRFGSVCSGIEAASVAWHPLGWQAAWLAEIEPFPSAVLAHHYPNVPNLGDMTLLPEKILSGEVEAPDLFCGGTPCQAFSVAGLRNSLADARGNLSLTFVGIANAIDHVRSLRRESKVIIFWENVPGVLNTKDNAFGCFLGALAGEDDPVTCTDGKWSGAGVVIGQARTVAWRTLDAQYFGVAQRRRRVFVVASARDGFDPVAVLFESEGVRRDTAPSREAGESAAASAGSGFDSGGLQRTVGALCADTHPGAYSGQDAYTGRLIPQPIPIHDQATRHAGKNGEKTMGKGNGLGIGQPGDPMNTLTKGDRHAVAQPITPQPTMQVRRLTCVEAERLQGFPDNYTNIPWRKKDEAPDGPRYKALGNSWAVPVVAWIGKRIKSAL